MPNTTNDTVTNEAQAAAALAQVADYTKVTGAVGSFDEVAGKIEGERRVKLLSKLEPVVAGIRQSVRDNQIAIAKLEEEIKTRSSKVEYMVSKEAELKSAVDSNSIASITDLNNFMGAEGNRKLATTVGYALKS